MAAGYTRRRAVASPAAKPIAPTKKGRSRPPKVSPTIVRPPQKKKQGRPSKKKPSNELTEQRHGHHLGPSPAEHTDGLAKQWAKLISGLKKPELIGRMLQSVPDILPTVARSIKLRAVAVPSDDTDDASRKNVIGRFWAAIQALNPGDIQLSNNVKSVLRHARDNPILFFDPANLFDRTLPLFSASAGTYTSKATYVWDVVVATDRADTVAMANKVQLMCLMLFLHQIAKPKKDGKGVLPHLDMTHLELVYRKLVPEHLQETDLSYTQDKSSSHIKTKDRLPFFAFRDDLATWVRAGGNLNILANRLSLGSIVLLLPHFQLHVLSSSNGDCEYITAHRAAENALRHLEDLDIQGTADMYGLNEIVERLMLGLWEGWEQSGSDLGTNDGE